VIINRKNKEIIDIRQGKGRVHDFELFKATIGASIDESIKVRADLGYPGIKEYHANSVIPKKASKNRRLTDREKAYNTRLARQRVMIEHINAKIKTFKITAYPYRNHCKRHLLRMTLICGLINFELRL
jgi:hypothetical protein